MGNRRITTVLWVLLWSGAAAAQQPVTYTLNPASLVPSVAGGTDQNCTAANPSPATNPTGETFTYSFTCLDALAPTFHVNGTVTLRLSSDTLTGTAGQATYGGQPEPVVKLGSPLSATASFNLTMSGGQSTADSAFTGFFMGGGGAPTSGGDGCYSPTARLPSPVTGSVTCNFNQLKTDSAGAVLYFSVISYFDTGASAGNAVSIHWSAAPNGSVMEAVQVTQFITGD